MSGAACAALPMASIQRRCGSTISNSVSRVVTTCPARTLALRDDAADRRLERDALGVLGCKNALLFAQSLELGAGVVDVLLGDDAGDAGKARKLLLGDAQLADHFGRELLHGPEVGDGNAGRQKRQHLPLLDALPDMRDAAVRKLDAPVHRGLHLPEGRRVGHHGADELARFPRLLGLGDDRAHMQQALRRLG